MHGEGNLSPFLQQNIFSRVWPSQTKTVKSRLCFTIRQFCGEIYLNTTSDLSGLFKGTGTLFRGEVHLNRPLVLNFVLPGN